MWDGYEEQTSNKPYIWIAFFLVLLVMSSIFFLRPSIGGLPAGEMPSSKNVPLVTPLQQDNTGVPIHIRNSVLGFWSVRAAGANLHIGSLDALGLTLWNQQLTISDPLISSRGAYLAVAEVGGNTVTVFHGTGMQIARKEISGNIQSLCVSENGDIVVAFYDPEADSLSLRSQLMQMSSLGIEMWMVSLPGEVLKTEQSADGNVISVLGVHLEGATAKTTVAAYSRHGSRLFTKDLSGRPVDTLVRDDGDVVVAAAGDAVYAFDRQGVLQWSFLTGADVVELSFVGRSANLLFHAERRSLLTFGLQSLVGVLSEEGKLAWQYRSRNRITHVGTTDISSNILIGSEKSINLYSHDGNVRWSMAHQWGGNLHTATTDGRNYLVHSESESVLMRGQ